MVSLVEDFDDSNYLVARARHKGDLERIFPGKTVHDNMGGDYKYRCWILKEDAAQFIYDSILDIDYHNFKNSINKSDKERSYAYMNVWRVMYNYQVDEEKYGYK